MASGYRGNRLHILFSICAKYHEKYDAILSFLQSGTVACRGLTAAIANDFASVTAKCPWFVLQTLRWPLDEEVLYLSESGISHVEGIGVVKAAIVALKELPFCFEGAAIVDLRENEKPKSAKASAEGETQNSNECLHSAIWSCSGRPWYKFYLTLYMQERNADLRVNTNREPYFQTQSKRVSRY